MDYWSYYDNTFDWSDDTERTLPDYDLTRRGFAAVGYTESEIQSFMGSGYVMLRNDVIIDRFHGGALLSSDFRTRIPLQHFKDWFEGSRCHIPFVVAQSVAQAHAQVEAWRQSHRSPLVFRGQTTHHPLHRHRPNPCLAIPELGEVSLLPSLWRAMRNARPSSFLNFQGPILLEWERVIDAPFDVSDIERRVANIREGGGWIFGYQDMEDSDDPVLRAYGKLHLDLAYGIGTNLADLLNTLLQHYGLLSPVLDLTADLEVALFFATHRFHQSPSACHYEFVGTNNRRSILYVFRQNKHEMHAHEHEQIVEKIKPLRPINQFCIICRSAPFALNLAADFLVGVIKLDFDTTDPGPLDVAHLFPSQAEDAFLAALKKRLHRADLVTDFGAAAI